MIDNLFPEQKKIIQAEENNPMDGATDQPPREYKSAVLDAFKKAPSPSGAIVSHP